MIQKKSLQINTVMSEPKTRPSVLVQQVGPQQTLVSGYEDSEIGSESIGGFDDMTAQQKAQYEIFMKLQAAEL